MALPKEYPKRVQEFSRRLGYGLLWLPAAACTLATSPLDGLKSLFQSFFEPGLTGFPNQERQAYGLVQFWATFTVAQGAAVIGTVAIAGKWLPLGLYFLFFILTIFGIRLILSMPETEASKTHYYSKGTIVLARYVALCALVFWIVLTTLGILGLLDREREVFKAESVPMTPAVSVTEFLRGTYTPSGRVFSPRGRRNHELFLKWLKSKSRSTPKVSEPFSSLETLLTQASESKDTDLVNLAKNIQEKFSVFKKGNESVAAEVYVVFANDSFNANFHTFECTLSGESDVADKMAFLFRDDGVGEAEHAEPVYRQLSFKINDKDTLGDILVVKKPNQGDRLLLILFMESSGGKNFKLTLGSPQI